MRLVLCTQVSIGIDPVDIFAGADWALMVGAQPRGPGMERSDLIQVGMAARPWPRCGRQSVVQENAGDDEGRQAACLRGWVGACNPDVCSERPPKSSVSSRCACAGALARPRKGPTA